MTEEKKTTEPAKAGHAKGGKASKKPRLSPEQKRKLLYVLAAVALVGIVWYAVDSYFHEETDDAYVSGHVHYVAPRISGVVQRVLVNDNQDVKAGQPLVIIDPADYQTQYDEARADHDKAQLDYNMMTQLGDSRAVSQQDIDHARTTLAANTARLAQQKLQLDYTVISAPTDGRVGRKNVEVGNHVQPGQSLMAVVEPDAWVVANFKETQVAHMSVGQEVRMTIDAIPGKTFTGHVDSFSPASGNQFALLPADNSTGNFTKIVQRLPVKIVFDPGLVKGYEERISPGLSVIVKVKVR
jgi:membrane fusion protein (multidrug efflux system)